MLDDNHFPKAFRLFEIVRTQGTNDKLSPLSNIRKERCPGYKVGFHDKILAELLETFNHNNRRLTWKPKYYQLN